MPAERSRRLSRAGTPAIGVSITTDDEGEVLARSNHVFDGYWDQPAETARPLSPAAGSTPATVATSGRIHDDAYLTISDRKKDVIISGGENVSSIEVEDCLYQHPEVAEVAVIGVPDDRWGETVKALVVLRPDATVDEAGLIEFTRERMSHFKCPTLRRVPRRASPHRDRQAAEVQAPRDLLEGPTTARSDSRSAIRSRGKWVGFGSSASLVAERSENMAGNSAGFHEDESKLSVHLMDRHRAHRVDHGRARSGGLVRPAGRGHHRSRPGRDPGPQPRRGEGARRHDPRVAATTRRQVGRATCTRTSSPTRTCWRSRKRPSTAAGRRRTAATWESEA